MKTQVFERISIPQIAKYWFGNVVVFSALYYGLSYAGATIMYNGSALTSGIEGLGNSIYFSFTTALTLGYGNIAPVGVAKALAVIEAITSVGLIGMLVAKFVSNKQEQIIEEIEELSFEEAAHKTITELYLFRNQAEELESRLSKAKKDKNLSKELDSLQLTLIDALQTFNGSKPRIDDPQQSMHIALVANSINYSLSRLVGLLEEFNKGKTGWNKESTTSIIDAAKQTAETLKQQIQRMPAAKNVEEKLEDLNKAIADLQKSIQK